MFPVSTPDILKSGKSRLLKKSGNTKFEVFQTHGIRCVSKFEQQIYRLQSNLNKIVQAF